MWGLLACALCLDALVGEPRALWSRVPHPAVLMGRAVAFADRMGNDGAARRFKGTLSVAALVILSAAIGGALSLLGGVVEGIVAAILLAHRSLVAHVGAVAHGLRQSLDEGRRAVRLIVSRDVAQTDTSGVSRAAIESLAENFSDGVVAPAFWFAVAGLPGILVYKMVNTADSMIGYLTPRHAAFGRATAKLDDLLNWVPARLSAGLIALAGGVTAQAAHIRADARLHKSPNAGWPEAAMARALGIALAGPRPYHGTLQDLAWVNPQGRRALQPSDIDQALAVIWRAWALFLTGVIVLGGIAWAV